MSSEEDSDPVENVSQKRIVGSRLELWDHFIREDRKYMKTKHRVATCKSCVKAGKKSPELRGEKSYLLRHLHGCVHVPSNIKKQHKQSEEAAAPAPSTPAIKRSVSGGDPASKRVSLQSGMQSFLDRPLSKTETAQFERLLAECFIDCNVSFKSIEKQSFIKLLTFLRPTVKLPGRTAFRTRIIAERIAEAQSEIDKALKSQLNVTLTFDGFKDVSRNKLLGKLGVVIT